MRPDRRGEIRRLILGALLVVALRG